MLLSTLLLGILALTASAEPVDPAFEIHIGDSRVSALLRGVAAAERTGNRKLAKQLGLKLEKIRNAPTLNLQEECRVSSTLEAEIYAVDIARPPKQLAWAMQHLDEFWRTDDGRDLPYPGDFDEFMHRDGFRVIKMDFEKLPWSVKKWREEEMKKGSKERKFIAELDGVAFFAPGVVSWLLPLFAGADVELGRNACEDELANLDNYYKRKEHESDNVMYTFDYNNRVQVGNTVKLDMFAAKYVRSQETQEL